MTDTTTAGSPGNRPLGLGCNEQLGAGSEAHRMLLNKAGRKPGNRWFVQRGARTYYGHGFRSKAEADEWIDAHRRAELMDWRCGYRFRIRGDAYDVVIVNKHGDPASA